MKEEKLSVKEKLIRIIPNIKSGEYANIAIIFIVSIFVCLPLLNKNCNIYIDDGIQHLCRLIGTEQTLVSKQFLPMIMSNFCNNFGYSWNIFYSPLTAYIPLIFRIFSFSFEICLKLFMFVVTVATGIAMYKFVIKITKNKNIAILASVLYIIAPYRITDMYVRMALAELTSFIFIPMVFSGMYSIINENKKSSLLIIGASGLILTHTVVCMYTAMLCFVYLIVFIRKLNKKSILNLLVSLLMIVLITSFYWVGLAQHYFSTSYEVFVPGRMERVDVLNFYKTSLSQLVYTDQEQKMIYEIGIVTFIGLLLTPIAIMKFEKQEKEKEKDFTKIYGLFGILGIVLTIMTLKIFPFEKLPGTFTMIQFTFRLFEFTSFFFAIISAVNFWILIKNFNIRDVIIISLIACLLTTIYGKKISYEKKYDEKDFIEPRRVTKDVGRINAGMASFEYLPSKAFNCLKTYIADREDVPIILNNSDNQTTISDYEKNGSNMKMKILKASPELANGTDKVYEVSEELTNEEDTISEANQDDESSKANTTSEDIEIELPYIYYLGYRVKIDGKEVKYTESEHGFVQINIDKELNEEAEITVKYLGTNEMIIAFAVSLVSTVSYAIFTITAKRLKSKSY
jgi:antitoxin component of RelBE/YafQ-DinJ toxin-antitoxin module